MGTRCAIHFCSPYSNSTLDNRIEATVYQHYDGYPQNVVSKLHRFFEAVLSKQPRDTRFDDPSYLAARFLAWAIREEDENPLDSMTGYGILSGSLPGDLSYRYFVDCKVASGEKPVVIAREV